MLWRLHRRPGLTKDDDWKARIDLVLASGRHLLIMEFIRPGLTADWDHVDRFERYVRVLREKVSANTGKFNVVSGILVADHLERKSGFASRIESLRRDDMDAMDWTTLLSDARAQWIEYFDILQDRAPNDERMSALASAARALPIRHPQTHEGSRKGERPSQATPIALIESTEDARRRGKQAASGRSAALIN